MSKVMNDAERNHATYVPYRCSIDARRLALTNREDDSAGQGCVSGLAQGLSACRFCISQA